MYKHFISWSFFGEPRPDRGCFPFLSHSSPFVVKRDLTIERLGFLSVGSGRLSLGLVLLGDLGSIISVELVIDSLASRRRLVGSGVGVSLGVLNVQRYFRVCSKGSLVSDISTKWRTSDDLLEACSI